MPSIRLPKLPGHPWLSILLIFVLLILLAEVGYYYFRARKASLQPLPMSEETKAEAEDIKQLVATREKRAKEGFVVIKQALEEQREEIESEGRLVVTEACRQVSPENLTLGLYQLDKNPNTPDLADYFYDVRIDGVEERREGNCTYDDLKVWYSQDFTISIPKGILSTGSFGAVNASFLENVAGERVRLRIRYQGEAGSETLRFIEWEVVSIIYD